MISRYKTAIIPILFSLFHFSAFAQNRQFANWSVEKRGHIVCLKAGILQRDLELTNSGFIGSSLTVKGINLLSAPVEEITFCLQKAFPNCEPQGIEYAAEGGVEQADALKNQTDALAVIKKESTKYQQVQWIDSVRISKTTLGKLFHESECRVTVPHTGVKRVTFTFDSQNRIKGFSLVISYEIYAGYPVIRKWVQFNNNGNQWIKISDLNLEQLDLKNKYAHTTLLTPDTRGIDPSIIAFSDSTASTGIIAASEIPSKLRHLSVEGVSGYNRDFFEWVLGPGETFESEPVFIYGFCGKSYQTVSSESTALDRCVEDGFHRFLTRRILLPQRTVSDFAPLYCSWTNYNSAINDSNMRSAADVASRIGFKCFQLDAGWSDAGPNGGWAVSTPQPVLSKFPDMKNFSDYLQTKVLKTGLWYSVFLNEQLAEKKGNEPLLFSLPVIRRAGGLGISFCYDKSREKYVNDMVYLHKRYHADYFKQDLSNLCYGDIARGHGSRTLKESYLRGLRGLFVTQDGIHRQAPEVWLQLSHEIYWETPGPAADIAVLKHVNSYHAAPNEYWGAGNRSKLVSPKWKYNVDSLKEKLIQGAFRARNLLYLHRGLPLGRIEVFGAVTTNFRGSLTPEIQDRQVCSWLSGALLSFSGDLGSLTQANIERYHTRFGMLEKLQRHFNIYTCFQYSGVPPPTDEGWHWYGKLNDDGCGVVVVLRGSAGTGSQKINIPWVKDDKEYRLKGLFTGKELGRFRGKQLQNGDLMLELPQLGQEMIEVKLD